MAKRVITGVVGVVFLGAVLVRAVLDALNYVGTVLEILPAPVGRFIVSPNGTAVLLIFGFLLLWYALKHQQLIPAPAAVRLKCYIGGYTLLAATNIGGSEATDVQIHPLEIDNFPWVMSFDVVGSIPSLSHAVPRIQVNKRAIPNVCDECIRTVREPSYPVNFLSALADHLGHRIRLTDLEKSSEVENAFEIAGTERLPRRYAIWLVVSFFDGYKKDLAQHRLEIESALHAITQHNCVYLRERDKQRDSALVALP